MKAYEQATESAHQKERGYFAPEEEKEEWIREAVPIPYDENYHLIIDSKGITHNFTCEERNFGKKFMVSYEPTRKQCESCKGYDYWVEKYRPEHERRLRENLQPIVHGEKLLPDRVKEHILLSTDKMEGMEWYSSNRVKLRGRSSSTVYRDGDAIFVVEPYFGKDLATGKILFRMRTRYEDFRDRNYDSEWIFYERVQLLGVENDARLNIVPGSQKESNVADSGLQEWSDNLIDAEDFENLMKSKTIRVKFYGKYSREFDLTREQFLMFEEINYIYQKVK